MGYCDALQWPLGVCIKVALINMSRREAVEEEDV